MKKTVKMQESTFDFVTDLKEARVDTESRVIRGMVIMSKYSHDANGKIRHEFSDAAMRDCVAVFEGAPAYAGHAYTMAEIKERDNDPLKSDGVYRNVHLINEGTQQCKAVGDWHVYDGDRGDKILSFAKISPELAGNSICASGSYKTENGRRIFESIKLRTLSGGRSSVDLVKSPATTTNMFESTQKSEANNEKEEQHMNLSEATLANICEARPDLSAALKSEGAKSRDAEVAALKESKAAVEAELQETKRKLDEREVQAKMAAKQAEVDALITESKLPAEAITDVFRATLMAVQESKSGDKTVTVAEQVKALIEDRRALLGGVRGNTSKVGSLKESKLTDKEIAAGCKASRRG